MTPGSGTHFRGDDIRVVWWRLRSSEFNFIEG